LFYLFILIKQISISQSPLFNIISFLKAIFSSWSHATMDNGYSIAILDALSFLNVNPNRSVSTHNLQRKRKKNLVWKVDSPYSIPRVVKLIMTLHLTWYSIYKHIIYLLTQSALHLIFCTLLSKCNTFCTLPI
jgi:hypothetical protein